MIPKVIHYCWFGSNPIDEKSQKCIETWKEKMPEYEIKKWNEENFDINKNEFLKTAYLNKKWAFLSDYARLDIVYNNGGIYLDTDVEAVQSFDTLLQNKAFMGFEAGNNINTGIGFGAEKNNRIIKENLEEYDKWKWIDEDGKFCPPRCTQVTGKVLKRHGILLNNELQISDDITIYPSDFFAPMDYCTGVTNITENTISIHRYNMTWVDKKEQRWLKMERKLSKKMSNKSARKITRILSFPYRVKKKISEMGIKNAIKSRKNRKEDDIVE